MPDRAAPIARVPILRAASVSAVDDDARELSFVASDESVDRYGDIVCADGWQLDAFASNPIFLWMHGYADPIGTADVRVDGRRLLARAKFAPAGISQKIDELWQLVRANVLRAVSVGFTVDEGGWEYIRDAQNDRVTGIRYLRPELLELSLVTVPANRNALALARAVCPDPSRYFLPDAFAATQDSAAHFAPAADESAGASFPSTSAASGPHSREATAMPDPVIESPTPVGHLRTLGGPQRLSDCLPDDLAGQVERAGRVAFEVRRSIRDIALVRNVIGETVPTNPSIVAPTSAQLVDGYLQPGPLLLSLLPRVSVTGGSITQNVIGYATPNNAGNKAALVPEATAKPESDLVATSSVLAFAVWAHHIGVTKQALADVPSLRQLVDTVLARGLLSKVDGGVFTTLTGAATAFTPGAGSSAIDNAAIAAATLAAAGGSSVTVALNPMDIVMADIAKASGAGAYLGRPPINATLVGVPSVPTGKLLAFASEAAYIAEREAVNVVAGIANDDFLKNVVRLLCEWRGATVVQMPSLILYGNASAATLMRDDEQASSRAKAK